MKIIESNPYKVKSITLELTEYLEIKNNNINKIKILKLKKENKQLKNEIELLKHFQFKKSQSWINLFIKKILNRF